jgi:hypothetical protein
MQEQLQVFCDQARAALQQQPAADALPAIAQHLAALLADAPFVAATFDEETPAGKRLLFEDPATGFRVLAHVQPAGKGGAPHDHGASWAVYGNARGRTEMTEYTRVNDSSQAAAVLLPLPGYSLIAGQTRAYPSGAIHATAHPELAWVIRVTGTDLDHIERYRFRKAIDTVIAASDAAASH